MFYISGMLDAVDTDANLQGIAQRQARHIASLEVQVTLLTEQLSWLKKQLFGAKSERIVADLGQQSLPFAETEAAVPPSEATEEVSYQRSKALRDKGCDTLSYPEDHQSRASSWNFWLKRQSVRRAASHWCASAKR